MNREKYIENDVLCLAEVIESDYKTLYDSWNEEDTVLGYNYKLPYTFDEYCVNCRESNNWGAVIIRLEDNQVIGRIGISTGLPDLSITIFKPYKNQNYGTTAFLLGVKYCFKMLKLEKIYAGSYEDNIASRKMIELCGFKPNPDGNLVEPHIFSGKDRLQLDFVIENPRRNEMNNPHIIVIHGAPGSGKSTTAALLHERLRSPWFEFGWIPEFRNLNPHTEISFEQETELSFENLVLVVKNYIRHGFKNIIITDINFESQILRLPEVFNGLEYRLFTLYANDDTLKNRILSRDNGNTFRDWESSLKTNTLLTSRPLLQNEIRICTENISAAEVTDKIIGELSK